MQHHHLYSSAFYGRDTYSLFVLFRPHPESEGDDSDPEEFVQGYAFLKCNLHVKMHLSLFHGRCRRDFGSLHGDDQLKVLQHHLNKGCCTLCCLHDIPVNEALRIRGHYQSLPNDAARHANLAAYHDHPQQAHGQHECRQFYKLQNHLVCRTALLACLDANQKTWYALEPMPLQAPQPRIALLPTQSYLFCQFWLERYFNRSGDVMPNSVRVGREGGPDIATVPVQVNLPIIESQRYVYDLYVAYECECNREPVSYSMYTYIHLPWKFIYSLF